MNRALGLQIDAHLSPSAFAEVGRPGGAFRRRDGAFVALVGDFDPPHGPGAPAMRYRVTVYTGDLSRRLAVLDASRYPIHEVAFHPNQPIAAVATGSYDGGFLFEGELLLWDWTNGNVTRVLSEKREVTRLGFDDDGSLRLLLRARDEEDNTITGDPFRAVLGGRLSDLRPFPSLGLHPGSVDPRLATFREVEPAELGFDAAELTPETKEQQWRGVFGARTPEPRPKVRDLDWSEPQRILAVHHGCVVEGWSLDGQRQLQVVDGRRGVQLLRSAGRPIVHALAGDARGGRSQLLLLEDHGVVDFASFDHVTFCSVDRPGRILCRDTRMGDRRMARQDRLLDPTGRVSWSGDLGPYEPLAHRLRLDGGSAPYYLTTSSREARTTKLCLAEGDVTRECFAWDQAGELACHSTACHVSDGVLVRGFAAYAPGSGTYAPYLEGLDVAGRQLWRRDSRALVGAVAPIGDSVAFATEDGRLGLIRAATGDVLFEERVVVDGVDTVVVALAAHGDRLACGTIDGRVLVCRVGRTE